MSKYKLPPLVLFESHADRSVTDFLIRNLDYLREVGYTKICFELPKGLALAAVIQQMRMAIMLQSSKVSSMDFKQSNFQIEVEKLRSVASKQQLFLEIEEKGLRFKAIDMPVEKQMEYGLNSKKRNQMLTQGTIETAEEADGGVILVTGFGHNVLQEMIAHYDSGHADQYLWFHLHNPNYETEAHKELVRDYEKRGYENCFPLGVSILDVSTDTKIEEIDTQIKEAISKNCYNYVAEEVDTSTASILKQLLGPNVSAHLRTDGQHHVDAIIPLPGADSEISRGDFLRELSNTLKGISYEVEKGSAIIRDINDKPVAEQLSSLKSSKL